MWSAVLSALILSMCMCVRGEDSTRKEEVLVTGMPSAHGLGINWRTNILYFSYYNSELEKYLCIALELNTKTHSVIEELSTGACQFTVDQVNGNVYAGCWNMTGPGGLYQLNGTTGLFQLVGAEGENVIFAHYANGVLYYSTRPLFKVYAFSNGVTREVPELSEVRVYELVVDNAGGWVFRNGSSGVWGRPRGDGVIVRYVSTSSFSALGLSRHGGVYACDFDYFGALYHVDANATMRRVVSAPGCMGLTFDENDNFIYADTKYRRIVRLKNNF